jgi:peroxiredoxin
MVRDVSERATRSLQERLEECKAKAGKRYAADELEALGRSYDELEASGIRDGALRDGERAPDFELPNGWGEPVRLSNLLARGPVVLTFFRGRWCPYCRLQLKAYRDMVPDLEPLKASLVAVSPMLPEFTRAFVERASLGFDVLSDVGNTVARAYGLAYEVEGVQRSFHDRDRAAGMPAVNGDDSWVLPLTSTYVLDRDGIVRFATVGVRPSQRAEPAELLEVLGRLAER